uniref:Uncharacterized protein n=1 Tax=Hippocampus comes TaxID=109280 RepID=A0A3Q3DVK1_HIPCM
MALGSPTSPKSTHGAQFLPGFLMGDLPAPATPQPRPFIEFELGMFWPPPFKTHANCQMKGNVTCLSSSTNYRDSQSAPALASAPKCSVGSIVNPIDQETLCRQTYGTT